MFCTSRKRDGFESPLPGAESFEAEIDRHNDIWNEAARRFSPELLIDLLNHVGRQAIRTLKPLDPDAIGGPVSWAGPHRAPVWLDIARDYTDRWHHQQHIRDAVGRPGQMDRKIAASAVETFVHSLSWSFREVNADPGTVVDLSVSGEAGDRWWLVREATSWNFVDPGGSASDSIVQISGNGYVTSDSPVYPAWGAVPDAASYRVCVAYEAGDYCHENPTFLSSYLDPSTTSWTVYTPDNTVNELEWTVAACDGSNDCVWQDADQPIIVDRS